MPFWTQPTGPLFLHLFPIPCLVWLPPLRWACHFSSWNSLVVSSFKYAHKIIIGLKRCGDGNACDVSHAHFHIHPSQSILVTLSHQWFIYLFASLLLSLFFAPFWIIIIPKSYRIVCFDNAVQESACEARRLCGGEIGL